MALCLLYEVLRQKFCFFATHNVCNSQINEGAESRVNRVAVVSRRGTGEETFPRTVHIRIQHTGETTCSIYLCLTESKVYIQYTRMRYL